MIDILWLEDQSNKLEQFIDLAYEDGINLFVFETAIMAEREINLHPERYDAAILDARGFMSSTSEQANTKGMHKIKDLLMSKQIPFAIFSGEAGIVSNEEFINSLSGISVFKKGSEEENLLEHIKDLVKDSPNIKIKNDYKDAFKVFSNNKLINLIDDDDKLINGQQELIKMIRNKDDFKIVAGCIRSLFEGLIFDVFKKYGIIDEDEEVFNKQAISLDNRGHNYVGREYMGRIMVMTALNSQPLNHDVSKTAIGQYLNNAGNKYFIPLLVDSMLAVITWLPEFLKKNKMP